jgi:hypothetical protein
VVLASDLAEGRGPETPVEGMVRSVVRSLGHAG